SRAPGARRAAAARHNSWNEVASLSGAAGELRAHRLRAATAARRTEVRAAMSTRSTDAGAGEAASARVHAIDDVRYRPLAARLEPFDSYWQAPADVDKGYASFARYYEANYLPHLPAD